MPVRTSTSNSAYNPLSEVHKYFATTSNPSALADHPASSTPIYRSAPPLAVPLSHTHEGKALCVKVLWKRCPGQGAQVNPAPEGGVIGVDCVHRIELRTWGADAAVVGLARLSSPGEKVSSPSALAAPCPSRRPSLRAEITHSQ